MFLYNKKNIFYLFIFSLSISWLFLILLNNINSPNVFFGQVESEQTLNYLPCCGIRTSFYSYFTIFLAKFSNTLFLTRYTQLFFLVFSISFLSLEFYNLTKNKFFSILLFLSIILNIKFMKLGNLIYEDALYLPILVLILALLVKLINKFSLKTLGLLSLSGGALASIKLSGITIFAIFILLLIFIYNKRNFFLILGVTCIPFFLVIFLENYLYLANEEKRSRATILAISGKLPIISFNENPSSKYPQIYNYLKNKGEHLREVVSKQSNFSNKLYAQHVLVTAYQDFGLRNDWKDLEEYLELFNGHLGENQTLYDRQKLLEDIFLDSLKVNKLKLVQSTFDAYLGFWTLSEVLTQKSLNKLYLFVSNDFFKTLDPYIQKTFLYNINIAKTHAPISIPSKLICFVLNLVSLILFCISFFKIFIKKNKHKFYLIGLITSLYTHLYYVSISLVNVSFVRYFLTMWPLLMISLFLFFSIIYLNTNHKINIVRK